MTETVSFPVSVLDLMMIREGESTADALANARQIVRTADELGYLRYWTAEHHNSNAIAATVPAVLLANIGNETERIRLGSGGVMLPNHTPLDVAEQFSLLSNMYPDRIDLGLGRAPGTDPLTASALRGASAREAVERYPQHIVELSGFLGDVRPEADPEYFRRLRANADLPHPPQIWLLGSSQYSAVLAGQLGLPYAYAHHFSMGSNPVAAFTEYRENFQRSSVLAQPHALITASALVADTVDKARYLDLPTRAFRYQLMSGRPGPLMRPEAAETFGEQVVNREHWQRAGGSQHIGPAEKVATELRELVEATGADELMLQLSGSATEVRMHTLRELAPHLV